MAGRLKSLTKSVTILPRLAMWPQTKAAYTGGIDGCVDDVLALIRPWNFDVGTIRVPVSLWYGPDDVLCPRAHTDWLAGHIPGAEARELPGGHVLDLTSLRRLYTWLLDN